jgi:hypothetical protein
MVNQTYFIEKGERKYCWFFLKSLIYLNSSQALECIIYVFNVFYRELIRHSKHQNDENIIGLILFFGCIN